MYWASKAVREQNEIHMLKCGLQTCHSSTPRELVRDAEPQAAPWTYY